MSTQSFLLALDGSKESLAAANIAWKLAQAQDAKLVALSVVDNQAIWDLLGAGLPGFIGSGPYIAAYETIQKALLSVSETLLNAFESRSQTNQIETECIINEGDLLRQVFERSKEHNLVITGRRYIHPSPVIQDRHSFIRTSLSKRLAEICPCPLLIVPSEKIWDKARLILGDVTFNADTLLRFLTFTEPLKIPREVFCTGPEDNIAALVQKVTDLVPPDVTVLRHDVTEGDEPFAAAVDVSATTLLVVSTRQSLEGRETCSGVLVEAFLTTMPQVSVLLLPPAETLEEIELEKKKVASRAK